MAFSFSNRGFDPPPKNGGQIAPKREEIATVGTWSYDIERQLVRCCSITASLFNLSPEETNCELPFARIIDPIHPNDRKRFMKANDAAALRGGPFVAEYRTVSRSGEVRRVLDRGEYYKNAAGIVDRARGIVIDLTNYPPATLKAKAVLARGERPTAPLPRIANHCLSAWNIGQQLQPDVFDTLKPAFQNLLFELGLRIAETEAGRPVLPGKNSGLH